MNRVMKYLIKLLIFTLIIGSFNLEAREPGIKITVTIKSNVEFISETNNYKYSYEVISDKSSIQNVWIFDVDRKVDISNALSPEGWEFGEAVVWSGAGWHSSTNEIYDIKPGNSLSSFSYQSKGLPGIITYYAQGYTELPVYPNEEAAEEAELTDPQPDFFDDCVKGETIGPVTLPPEIFDSKKFLQSIIELKHQCYDLGWIDAKDVADGLDDKLNAAAKAIERGQKKTAKNILNAFMNMLDAQKDKHVKNEAYIVLSINVKYLIEHL